MAKKHKFPKHPEVIAAQLGSAHSGSGVPVVHVGAFPVIHHRVAMQSSLVQGRFSNPSMTRLIKSADLSG